MGQPTSALVRRSRSDTIRELSDRQQIEELMSRYAHAVDRHDTDLIRQVYHSDATDWHGPFRGNVEGFIAWVNPLHEGKTRGHTHNVTTHWSEIDGDSAWAETYVLFALFLRERHVVMLGSGRYIDRLERRQGRWLIADRYTVTDARIEADGSCFDQAPGGYPAGTWDQSDPSYIRPLTVAGIPIRTQPYATANTGGGPSVDDLSDRRAIRNCIVQALRGLDRNDRDLALRSFHAGALVEDGLPSVDAMAWIDAKFLDIANNDAAVSHHLTTQLVTVDQDRAKAESYIILVRRRIDGARAWVGSIRLLDDLRYLDGCWAIDFRQVVADWEFTADASLFNSDDGYLHGRRDREDAWFRRGELGVTA
ncbi:MAG: nuclear transport factor 2 family protein [Hyphomicrobiales bacterium]